MSGLERRCSWYIPTSRGQCTLPASSGCLEIMPTVGMGEYQWPGAIMYRGNRASRIH